ncbi:citrate/2-methylcitrate synthase [Luteipulveratus sp. YIM 133132]|uniref:citrate synthase (unknown stereospecificity) n=1 Tax=Luteipulveratus flavus TaxID=3031728 RepID=A0ABT6C7J4_9MICO|nr:MULTISPECIES: citrate/2-methylcitrate synthase [unclassified Luteipulveratus]MDE9366443.1 citrate/2-methylcitrate synthase [Luteipulveratus sp. YIM 133132]MDF8264282.1 citrate/2-methylcitrate synthase [Luteipulveratus sp. YIM 133296]
MEAADLMTAAAAADLLGVRRQTLYAYVSRGVLTRVHGTDARGHRVSLFDRREVTALSDRHRRHRVGTFELQIDTAVTYLDPAGRLLYRGRDACDLAVTSTYEQVTEMLWGTEHLGPWSPTDTGRSVWDRQDRVCPPDSAPASRLRVALALLAAEPEVAGAARAEPDPDAVRDLARTAIVTAAGSLGAAPREWPGSVAAAAAGALTRSGEVTTEVERMVDAALVLLADHELATSTIAARATASTHADPVVTLLTGAAAMGGPLHGRAGEASAALLADVLEQGAGPVVSRWQDDPPPGFGHSVYTDADPRAECLLDLLREQHPRLVEAVDDLCLQVRRVHGLAPNVDLAMATLAHALDLRSGSAEALFVLARLAGMTAHALEEREHRLRFRPRAIYTGEAPD